MRRVICIAVVLCLTLTGCNWMAGSYASVTPHVDSTQTGGTAEMTASNYVQLQNALVSLVSGGREKGIIYVGGYVQTQVDAGMESAVSYVMNQLPLGAYAVENITYELGNSGGKPAFAVEITYRRSLPEIRAIRHVADMDAAGPVILEALANCDASVVLEIDSYDATDLNQLIEDFGLYYPQLVMEVPQVAVGLYPDAGQTRILELKFSYQNSRDTLRQMQQQVADMFDAAELYVSGDGSDYRKFYQLYGFIMERFDYQVETSITPAYSLLAHGVGDTRAFAMVYAAMCRQAGLECYTVTGTRNGEPRYWNIVRDGDQYFHVDLLRCSDMGGFRRLYDADMSGYVWDYTAYPACVAPQIGDTDEEPTEEPTEEPSEPESTDLDGEKENSEN